MTWSSDHDLYVTSYEIIKMFGLLSRFLGGLAPIYFIHILQGYFKQNMRK